MPTRKELLESLRDEVRELGDSLDTNVGASQELCSELVSLRADITNAYECLDSVTSDAIEALSDRLSAFREEFADTFKEGASQLRQGLIQGHLIGGIVGNVVGGIIQDALHTRATDPRWIMARRIYDAIHLFADAQNAGQRHTYSSLLRLLRVHEFTAEQARYIVNLLLTTGVLREYEDSPDGTFLALDPENEVLQTLREGYSRNTLTYLTAGPAAAANEGDENE